jgi:hypothetical protein
MNSIRPLWVLVTILFAAGLIKYALYGSLVRNCAYSAQRLELSEIVAKGRFDILKPVVVTDGPEPAYQCLAEFKGIKGEVINDFGSSMPSQRLTPEDGPFRVVQAFSVTKHGITTIDSGPGPILDLVLENDRKERFLLATVYLGLINGERFMTLVGAERAELLDVKSFVASPDGRLVFKSNERNVLRDDGTTMSQPPLPETNYNQLRINCEKNLREGDHGCCLKGLDQMEKNHYRLFRGTCPKGYHPRSNACFTSLMWCQPD